MSKTKLVFNLEWKPDFLTDGITRDLVNLLVKETKRLKVALLISLQRPIPSKAVSRFLTLI